MIISFSTAQTPRTCSRPGRFLCIPFASRTVGSAGGDKNFRFKHRVKRSARSNLWIAGSCRQNGEHSLSGDERSFWEIGGHCRETGASFQKTDVRFREANACSRKITPVSARGAPACRPWRRRCEQKKPIPHEKRRCPSRRRRSPACGTDKERQSLIF